MVTTQFPLIQIFQHANTSFTVQFFNNDTKKYIGYLHTWNYDVINRIKKHCEEPVEDRQPELKINGYTLAEAYEAVEFEFINQ